jgi:hypothetical protein
MLALRQWHYSPRHLPISQENVQQQQQQVWWRDDGVFFTEICDPILNPQEKGIPSQVTSALIRNYSRLGPFLCNVVVVDLC